MYGIVKKVCSPGGCKVIKTFKNLKPAQGYSYTDAEAEKYFLDRVTKYLSKTQFKHFSLESTFDHEANTAHTKFEENLGTLELKTYDLDQLKAYLIEIFSTLDYLYDKGILHMDLKPSNVLVLSRKNVTLPTEIKFDSFSVAIPDVPNYAKIIDWGVSVDYKNSKFYELFEDKMDCLRPAYDLVRMLYFLSQENEGPNKDFLHRIARAMFGNEKFSSFNTRRIAPAMFGNEKFPSFNTGEDCSRASENIKKFRFKDLFLLRDSSGYLFDIKTIARSVRKSPRSSARKSARSARARKAREIDQSARSQSIFK